MTDKEIFFVVWSGAITCFALYYIVHCIKGLKDSKVSVNNKN